MTGWIPYDEVSLGAERGMRTGDFDGDRLGLYSAASAEWNAPVPLRRGQDETEEPHGRRSQALHDGTLSSALRLGPGQSNAVMKIV